MTKEEAFNKSGLRDLGPNYMSKIYELMQVYAVDKCEEMKAICANLIELEFDSIVCGVEASDVVLHADLPDFDDDSQFNDLNYDTRITLYRNRSL